MTDSVKTLSDMLLRDDSVSGDLLATLVAIAGSAQALAKIIASGPLGARLDKEVGENSDGDAQKLLDVLADELFADALSAVPVRWYASEERPEIDLLNTEGSLAVAIDPLDGSSNIDANISIGTIFSVFDAKEGGWESFCRAGREQIAAGYVVYGPQTCFVVATANHVYQFILHDGEFVSVSDELRIPDETREFAINASNYRHWAPPVRAFVDDCIAGEDGPYGENLNMRWVASLVAEAHRILKRGGIFLYPADARPGYDTGRLRLIYECAPIAFVIERAGGRATDGIDPILDMIPHTLHQRVPLVFGSSEKVCRVSAYHDLPEGEVSALFGRRGLFRA